MCSEKNPRIRLGVSHQRPEQLTDDHLNYLKQMGVESLEVRTPRDQSSLSDLQKIRRRVEKSGLELFEIMLADMYNLPETTVGGSGRNEEVEFFKRFLRDLGKAGIGTTTYAWHTLGVYQTGESLIRGCRTRLFNLEEALKRPNLYDREYTDEEMWENYEVFIGEVLPVAEEAGVRLQLHPNDPPVTHQGVAKIFRSTAAFRRAMEIACNSPYSGILFCVGCWGEMVGPEGRGEDVVGAIRDFGSRGQIYQVHFRNVSSTLPVFHETFPDNGYLDLHEVMKALADTGFDGMVVPDHVPVCEGSEASPKAAENYIFGYIRALIEAVEKRGDDL
jgi:mannonate dehydratase